MLNFLIVFLAGGVGSVCRYVVSFGFPTQKSFATIIVNVTGCFLIAIADGLLSKYNANFILNTSQLRLLFIIGFLGGFTTYSSFLLDIFDNVGKHGIEIAILYLFSSIFLGLLAFFMGLYIIKII